MKTVPERARSGLGGMRGPGGERGGGAMLLRLAALATAAGARGTMPPAAAATPPAASRCFNSTAGTYSTTACPARADCCAVKYAPSGYGCSAHNPANMSRGCGDGGDAPNVCCKPGPERVPSATLPSCLVIGDSVSVRATVQFLGLAPLC